MNLRETLKSYLQRPYESIDSFLENVIYPVFGEDKFVFDGNYNVLKRNPELQPRAEECGIQSLTFVGHILTEGQELNIFDITVNSHRQLARSRVAIQSIVKSLMGSYSGAFMIFHYRTMEGRWDWRFTFCQKGASNADSSDAKRYTFLLGPSQSCRTAAENFIKIHDKIEREGEFEMDDIVRAFDVEALSKEFFDKYVDFYQNYFVKYMCDEANGMRQDFVTTDFDHTGLTPEQIKDREEKPIRDYLKKLLGRLVFLQFLQKKGWMGVHPDKAWGEGDYDFMRQLFLHATPEQQANFLDGVLEPLFTALNTQRPNDTYDTQVPGIGIVKIPYLNGGLFERDSSDEPITVFPAEYFGKLLEFFYEYNFTIDENDPNDAEVGVDPEMLGKIFESQLEDNKDKGAFYTPKEIVQYMCRESLVAYLTNCAVQKNGDKFPREETEKAVRNLVQTPEVIVPKMKPEQKTYFGEALRSIKICDPAIGSGAFPMGLLNELVRLRIAIGAWADKPEDVAALKKEIIQNNIYGVDIEQGAIDIARLRFWLSIMVDLEEPEALPNFDYKFMQGNSLITTFGGEFINLDTKVQKHERWEEMDKEKHVLYDLKKQYFTASGEEKLSLGIKIKDSILRLISMQLGYESRSWVARHAEQTSLFEEAKQLSFDDIIQQLPPEKQRVINLCKELHAQLENKSLPLSTRAHTDIRFFDWRMMFTEVFDNANPGFDVVIGNPPYIQLQREGGTLANMYSTQGFETFNKTGDIYSLFYEKGMSLSKHDGVLCYITSNGWMRNDSGKETRKFFAEKCDPVLLVNFAGLQLFNATVETNILMLKNNQNKKETLSATLDESCDFQNDDIAGWVRKLASYIDFSNDDSWVILTPIESQIMSKINKIATPLSKWDININFGLKTGYNTAFIIDTETRNSIYEAAGSAEKELLDTIILPVLRGRDIKRYVATWDNKWIINTHNGIPNKVSRVDISALPALKCYLDTHWDKISSRSDKGATPYNLRNCAYLFELSEPKIIWGEISDRSKFCYDELGEYVPEATTFFMTGEISIFLLCYLNSKLSEFLFSKIATTTGMGTVRWKKYKIEQLKVPRVSVDIEKRIEDMYNQYRKTGNTSFLDDIDRIIYQLYNLTPEEIALIEQ